LRQYFWGDPFSARFLGGAQILGHFGRHKQGVPYERKPDLTQPQERLLLSSICRYSFPAAAARHDGPADV
jgi:hypothetical protein